MKLKLSVLSMIEKKMKYDVYLYMLYASMENIGDY